MTRLRLRMSQESLGKAIGQDQQYISKLERGHVAKITVPTLVHLADVLGVSTDFLLNRTEKETLKLCSAAVA
jgi:transcriptional regulator with XRE-family HTH domain